MCWTLEDYMMNPMGSYEEWSSRVELIASMAWKRSLIEHSCLSPSHHIYQEKKMKCKSNMIYLGRYHLIESYKGDMQTELSEALP